MEQEKEKYGRPNSYFARRVREMVQKGDKEKFFVSMVPRPDRYKIKGRMTKKTRRYDNVDSRLMNETETFKSKVRTRILRSKMLQVERIRSASGRMQRSPSQGNRYVEHEHTSSPKKYMRNVEGYPNNENNNRHVNIEAESDFNYKNRYLDSDLQQFHREEAVRRTQIGNMLDDYTQKMRTNATDPGVYFNRISRNMDNLRKNFMEVSQNLDNTNKYIDSKFKNQRGSKQLVARGAGHIIKMYSDRLVEMLLDDMIYEMIPILQEKEMNEEVVNKRRMKREMFNNCMEALKDLTYEQNKLQNRADEVYTMTTTAKNRIKELEKYKSEVRISEKTIKKKVEITDPFVKTVKESKENYKDHRKKHDIYSEKNLVMIDIITRSMLDDLTKDVMQQFLNAQDEFVEHLVLNEFEL